MYSVTSASCGSLHCLSLTLCFHLGVGTDGLLALGAGVGAELVKALGADVLVILLHVLLPVQVVTAVVAVEALTHGGGEITLGTWGGNTAQQDLLRLHTPSSFPQTPGGDSVALFFYSHMVLWAMQVEFSRWWIEMIKSALQPGETWIKEIREMEIKYENLIRTEYDFKGQVPPKVRICSLMESQVEFWSQQNISGASQQNNVTAFS